MIKLLSIEKFKTEQEYKFNVTIKYSLGKLTILLDPEELLDYTLFRLACLKKCGELYVCNGWEKTLFNLMGDSDNYAE